jgi:hypothetical protein
MAACQFFADKLPFYYLLLSRHHHITVMCILQTGNERLLGQCKIPFPDTLLHLVQICFQTLSKQHRHNKIARHRQNRIALQVQDLSRRPFHHKTHVKLAMQAVNRVLLARLRLADNQNGIILIHYIVSPFLWNCRNGSVPSQLLVL